MARLTIGRAKQGTKKSRRGKNAALIGAAAATAVAMTVGATVTPQAHALPSVFDGTTTGPLFWLINQVGVDSVTIPNVPVIGNLTVNLDYTEADPVALYNAVNAAAFGSYILGTASRPNIFVSGTTATGPLLIASGLGAEAAVEAYQAVLASGAGNTPAGYTPLTAAGKVSSITGLPCTSGLTCVQGVNQTNLPLVLVNNPGTPNGGLYARFSQIFQLFGINPVTPAATSSSSTGIRVNSAQVNVGLGYNALSDFPATANLFSLANTLMATFLPTYLLGGGALQGASQDTIVTNLVALMSLGVVSTTYSTFAPTDLPLLEALRLPVRVINLVAKQLGFDLNLPTPIADALQPAAEILVNIGYTDVQTPTEGGTYNRTYDQSGTLTPWLSVNPLTPAEWRQVPGDVFHALIDGIVTEIHTLFGGGSTPVPAAPAAAAVSAAAVESSAPDVEAPTAETLSVQESGPATAPPSVRTSTAGGSAGGSAKGSKKSGSTAHASGGSASNDGPSATHRGAGGAKKTKAGHAA